MTDWYRNPKGYYFRYQNEQTIEIKWNNRFYHLMIYPKVINKIWTEPLHGPKGSLSIDIDELDYIIEQINLNNCITDDDKTYGLGEGAF